MLATRTEGAYAEATDAENAERQFGVNPATAPIDANISTKALSRFIELLELLYWYWYVSIVFQRLLFYGDGHGSVVGDGDGMDGSGSGRRMDGSLDRCDGYGASCVTSSVVVGV